MTESSGRDDTSIVRYDLASGESPSAGVVAAVSIATGFTPVATDATDPDAVLEPLYTAVDPDALDAVVGGNGSDVTSCRVTFTYHDHEVTVHDTDQVVVKPFDRAIDVVSD